MQIRNRIFPYPILNHNTIISNIKDSDFELIYEAQETENAYLLKNVHFNTNSKVINRLFKIGKIKVVCIVECSRSIYRKAFQIDDKKGNNIELSKYDFTEKVFISCFAYATENFIFESEEFDEEYQGMNFEIEKYDIIAANDGYNVYFNHEESESSLISSIFSIIPLHSITDGTYKVDYSSEKKIVISLSDEDHKNYKLIYAVPTYKEVFFNMILIPSLTEALTKCIYEAKTNPNIVDAEDVANTYLWFRSILSSYKRLTGIEMTKELLEEQSPILLAQQLLGKPLGISLKKLVEETTKVVKEEFANE